MRDPERIERILAKIRQVWYQHPDQRLGQLLVNYGGFPSGDPFFREDSETEACLNDHLSLRFTRE